jgi:hypothetical protein
MGRRSVTTAAALPKQLMVRQLTLEGLKMASIDEMISISSTRPPAPYIGGKRLLSKAIVERINSVPHKRYCEPFVGMGGVFFRRSRIPRVEIINDWSGDVANLFRILQRHYPQFMDVMKYQLTSRSEFDQRHFIHTLHPRAIIVALPSPDGSSTCRSRREEGLRGLAVTCGGTMEEAVHRRVPLAAGSASTGALAGRPDGRIGQASHRRNPCPLCPASAGRLSG